MESSQPSTTNDKGLTHHPNGEDNQTFIFLHGRGDRASSFGPDLRYESLPDGSTLSDRFPNARWIFPQAPLSSLAADPTWKFYQWFDVWSLHPGEEESDLQISGLRNTVKSIHDILTQQVEAVGAENVVLGGLSQGCAASLIALLLWRGPPIAAFVGMSGWLPFRKLMEDATRQDTMTADDTKTEDLASPARRAVSALESKLGQVLSSDASFPFEKIPIFLGHGTDDHTVVPRLGKEAAVCLGQAGAKVEYQEYEGLGHWYSGEMLEDAAQVIKDSGLAD